MAGAVKDYRELRVYTVSLEIGMRVFEVSRGWPVEETCGLTDQVRRSSRMVSVWIASAWQQRRAPEEFAARMCNACASAEESCVWLEYALRCGYLPLAEHAQLVDPMRMVASMLNSMIRRADRWCGKG